MKVIAGTDNGLVKSTTIETKETKTWGELNPTYEISSMTWWNSFPENDYEVVTAHPKGIVRVWDVEHGIQLAEMSKFEKLVKIQLLHSYKNLLTTCSKNGIIDVRNCSPGNQNFVPNCKKPEKQIFPRVIRFETKVNDINQMQVDLSSLEDVKLALGGKGSDLQIWSMENKKCIWKAKNVPNNRLNLPVPIHITDLAYIPNESSKIVVSTGNSEIRLYDIKAQHRPVHRMKISKFLLNKICVSNCGRFVIFSDVTGVLQRIDLRNYQVVQGYKLNSGTVKDIAIHPTLPKIAVCGYSRFLNIYNFDNPKPISSIYLKQKCTSLLFSPETSLQTEQEKLQKLQITQRKNNEYVATQEEEEMWASIPNVEDKNEIDNINKVDNINNVDNNDNVGNNDNFGNNEISENDNQKDDSFDIPSEVVSNSLDDSSTFNHQNQNQSQNKKRLSVNTQLIKKRKNKKIKKKK
eukprot:TRINITY_DN148_c0_g2_i1.p1 TRINITY_DN148_c0_g2~~TRINITY_DN148_c0_g2_i1.p1  ORF type:complete len:463 (-),score=189.88 TRINITY_DN148_c0_g2_i1:37-1425(-)